MQHVPARFFWKPHRAHLSMKNSASTFHTQTHQNALRDPQILADAKTHFQRNVSFAFFMETTLGPVEHETYCVHVLHA
jgi:hypothetical protein